ncbi:hypothetical protein [Kerstersia similis]|uniref:hypothetical protein n=1 Tax=Kerstersia similis TaxID=206505 RepID=UPI0039F04FAE
MPEWAGAVIGAVIGFFAVFLSAWLGAWLSVRRDEQVRKAEAESVKAAIAAELAGYIATIFDRFAYAMQAADVDDPGQFPAERASVPRPTVWPALAGRIGMLDASEAQDIVSAWQQIELLMGMAAEYQSSRPSASLAASRMTYASNVIQQIQDCVQALTGIRPPSPTSV